MTTEATGHSPQIRDVHTSAVHISDALRPQRPPRPMSTRATDPKCHRRGPATVQRQSHKDSGKRNQPISPVPNPQAVLSAITQAAEDAPMRTRSETGRKQKSLTHQFVPEMDGDQGRSRQILGEGGKRGHLERNQAASSRQWAVSVIHCLCDPWKKWKLLQDGK